MLELERLNVRVVSGRSGVKEEEFGADDGQQGMPGMPSHGAGMDPNMVSRRFLDIASAALIVATAWDASAKHIFLMGPSQYIKAACY